MAKGKAYPRAGVRCARGKRLYSKIVRAMRTILSDPNISLPRPAFREVDQACRNYSLAYDAVSVVKVVSANSDIADICRNAEFRISKILDQPAGKAVQSDFVKSGSSTLDRAIQTLNELEIECHRNARRTQSRSAYDTETRFPGHTEFIHALRQVFDDNFGHIKVRGRLLSKQNRPVAFVEFCRVIFEDLPAGMRPDSDHALGKLIQRAMKQRHR